MPKRAIRPEDLRRLSFVSDPQFSPDGKRVLFACRSYGDRNRAAVNLFMVELETGLARQMTQGEKTNAHARWSPDGSQIAFISTKSDPGPQIFLLAMDGGESRQLSKLPEGSVGQFRWSPDGFKIAFTFRETAPEQTKDEAKKRKDEDRSDPPLTTEEVWYRLDGDGYFGHQRYKIHVLDVRTGRSDKLYADDANGNYSFDWLKDSSGLVVSHSVNPQPMLQDPNDQIFIVPLKGKPKRLPGLPEGRKNSVELSPQGDRIAYLGNADDKDPWGVRNTRLYVTSIDGGEVSCLTEKDDYCLGTATLSDSADPGYGGNFTWAPDGKSIYVQLAFHGQVQVGKIDASKGGVKPVTEGDHALFYGSLSANGKHVAVALTDPLQPTEIATVDVKSGDITKRTSLNEDFLDQVKLSAPETMWLDSSDGVRVQAWEMKPLDFQTGRKYPAVLEIHGGPHTQYGFTFFHEFQVLAAEGYVVVFSNPRGSKGYGEEFTAAIRASWGDKDWDDIETVTRWMQHQPYIHPGRIGVMGGSYGGYMTNWAVGHSDAYRAAITDRCVSNMVSFAGNSDFVGNRSKYFGGNQFGPLENIEPLWKQSPMSAFDKVDTPMLIIHSEGDLRCNIEQSEQVFVALKTQGIDARFVRYPRSTSHGMSRGGPADLRIHRLREIIDWWDRYLH